MSKWIQSEDWADKVCSLVCETTGLPVYQGDVMRGHLIKGGRAPHKPSSTGRVWTDSGEFFPSVVGAKWARVEA